MSRRRFLQRAALVGLPVAGAAVGLVDVFDGSVFVGPAHARRSPSGPRPAPEAPVPSTTTTVLPDPSSPATAAWVRAENQRRGTTGWIVTGSQVPHAIEGYAGAVSALRGKAVELFVSTVAGSFHVEAYRMGWYQGLGARMVWRSPSLPGARQPPPAFTPGVNMVECRWSPSLRMRVGSDWPPGYYLLKLVGSGGEQQLVPFLVRDDSSRSAYLALSAVCTWQAYNRWGGYSLYYGGPGAGSFEQRARVVSFDRPYPLSWANGAADFIGNEYPLVMLMEREGMDVSYLTDVDLHARPALAARHGALLSLGHDEYWSAPMRDGALAARDAGSNLAFLGANACFRHIRLEASRNGPYRRQVCYKVASEDPMYGVRSSEVTSNWPDGPDPWPESLLIGDMYQSNGVQADLVVGDASSWPWQGTGASDGDRLAGVVGPEYDGWDPAVSFPPNLQVVAHSPVAQSPVAQSPVAQLPVAQSPVAQSPVAHSPVDGLGQQGWSDVTWYTLPGGGGVFATGTNYWVNRLSDNQRFNPALVPKAIPGVTAALTQVTWNVLAVLGAGPASQTRPAVGNVKALYAGTGVADNARTSWPA